MGIRISGTSVDAEVNSNNELKVALAATQANAGFAALAVEQGASTEPTAARKVRRLKASLNRRLAVGMDTVTMNENFIAAAQNTALWRNAVTNFTFSFATPGYVIFNSAGITTSGAAALYQSYQHTVLGGQKPVTVDIPFMLSATPPANWQMDFGLAAAPIASTPFALTDGVYVRINSSGLFLVLNYAGTETVSGALVEAADITPLVSYTVRLVIAAERTEVWLNDPNGALGTPDPSSFAYAGALDTPPANPFPCVGLSQPFSARLYHSAAAGAAVQFRLGGPSISEGDVGQNRSWNNMQARMGLISSQGQNGQTMGTTALYSNSLAAGAGAAMTNTTAALGVGFGGQFTTQPTLAAGTDGIVCSYLNPVPTTAIQGKTKMIYGVRIQGVVTSALTGGPVIYAYSLAYGHTSLSMATAEGIAAKAPRRIPLGIETFAATAAAATLGQSVFVPFPNGIPVNPGEYVAICAKNLGTVTSGGTITILVMLDSIEE